MATHDILFRGLKESVCKSDGEPSIVARKYEVAWMSRTSAVRKKELVRARATLQLAHHLVNVLLLRALGVFGELFDLCLDLLSFSIPSS